MTPNRVSRWRVERERAISVDHFGWTAALAGLGLFWLYMQGRNGRVRRVGWLVGLADEAVWIAYAWFTSQYPYALSALAYAWVYWKNYQQGRAAAGDPKSSGGLPPLDKRTSVWFN